MTQARSQAQARADSQAQLKASGSADEAATAPALPAPRLWFLAARPRTLTAAVAPVLVGSAVAASLGGFKFLPALAALLSSMCIQIGTNFANDYSDFKRGADKERVGPTRVTQSGLIAPATVKRAALLMFGLAALIGLYIAYVGGWPMLLVGTASVIAGWAYTGGPWPLGYHGLGDLFVLVFFGFVATVGTVFIQLHALPLVAFLAAVPVGALATAILIVNNLRDRETDARVGKRTLAVKLGAAFTRGEYLAMLALAVLAPLAGVALGLMRPLCLCALPALLLAPVRRVLRESGAALNPALGGTARVQLLYGLLFALGLSL